MGLFAVFARRKPERRPLAHLGWGAAFGVWGAGMDWQFFWGDDPIEAATGQLWFRLMPAGSAPFAAAFR